MPELPEVEVLVRHLTSQLPGKTIRQVRVLAPGSLKGATRHRFQSTLTCARFESVRRRGKYLLLTFRKDRCSRLLITHLGMSGRLYLDRAAHPLPRHARIVIGLGRQNLVFEDMRRFGGMTLDASALDRLGPEPLDPGFTTEMLRGALGASRQPIKVRLLDQSVIAGIGNIYASEALFLARIDPRTPSCDLPPQAIQRLRIALRRVLFEAIRFGSTIPLRFGSADRIEGVFYHGQSPGATDRHEERLRVYDREGQPCRRCRQRIQRLLQAGRSTYCCPGCQSRQAPSGQRTLPEPAI